MEPKKIGNFEITNDDMELFMARLPQEQQMYAQMPEFQKQCEDRLTEIVMFAAYGEDSGLEETQIYKDALALARRDILGQMAMQNLMLEVQITEEEVKEFFEENKEKFAKPASASAKHILVASEDDANDIKAKIEASELTFEDAAKQHSSCPSSERGGDLGTFGPGQMVPEFDQAVFGADEVGTIIGPVKTQFGYHLITVTEKNDACPAELEDVKAQAEDAALAQKQNKVYEAKVEELKAKYL